MAAIFGEVKIFWKLPRRHSSDTLGVENFDEIALSHTVKEKEGNFCFAIFGKNSKIQNGRHFWGGENFWKLPRVHYSDTLWYISVDHEDKASINQIIKIFKDRNPYWEKEKVAISDKDIQERNVVMLEMPQIHLQICLFHGNKTIGRETRYCVSAQCIPGRDMVEAWMCRAQVICFLEHQVRILHSRAQRGPDLLPPSKNRQPSWCCL